MSDEFFDAERSSDEHGGPAVLPPVKPPSAGFLVQLFIVPALIVLAVVGVWALFGKIASSDEDWRSLVEDIRNTNEYRRWRGAYGLAMLLKHDQQAGADGQRLASNREVCRALVGLFQEELNRHSHSEDDLKQEAFLALTLGLLDSPATVLPALEQGMKPEQDREVRKNSIGSIAAIAGRGLDEKRPIDSPALVEDLVAATSDSDSLIRDAGTYALGLVPTPASRDRLKVLLTHADVDTRVNAAVALARQNSTAGYAVFKQILSEAEHARAPRPVETLLAVKNSLRAVRTLADKWTHAQRTELTSLIEPISKDDEEPRIRVDAIDVLVALRGK
jgi:HEAT repeat protein